MPEQILCFWALIILACPLLGFVLQVFFGRLLPRKGDWLPTFCMFVPLCIATWMMFRLLSSPGGIEPETWTPLEGWLGSGGGTQGSEEAKSLYLSVDFSILVDNLTVIMLFVVAVVSFFVHLYSWGYMHGEVRYNHFFAYLGLFSFSMLGLCMTSNLLFLFIFWELVGVCSYFLIGFYFEKKSAQNAGIKAFVTTRLGDVGFFAGIIIIAATVGSLDLGDVFRSIGDGTTWPTDPVFLGLPLLAVAGLLLFAGAVGKSAQFPLHIWLPDAMEGPTPVSALIHAATMVVAGVYLVGRMFPLLAGAAYLEGDFFQSTPLLTVALVGSFTAFFAATIAFAQTDIKKVLAYSTVSQLGYMMLGIGVGSISAGFFHLFTHAFFKALLFLCSGSVIHAVHSNEMDDMGGLRKKMPITWVTFLTGTLAISGLPFVLSGFYSKEAVLSQAYGFWQHGGSLLCALPFIFGIVTAGMTTFYMFRLFFRTFHGEPKNREAYEHAHESPWTMTVPLCALAFLAVIAGGVVIGHADKWFVQRVNSELVFGAVPAAVAAGEDVLFKAVEHMGHSPLVLGLSVFMFLAGLGTAWLFFMPSGMFYGREVVPKGGLLWPLYVGVKNLWYVDGCLTWLAMRVVHFTHSICGFFDSKVIDGIVNFWGHFCRFVTSIAGTVDYWGVDGTVRGIGDSTLRGGRWVRRIQTGLLQEYVYASLILFGCVVLISVILIALG